MVIGDRPSKQIEASLAPIELPVSSQQDILGLLEVGKEQGRLCEWPHPDLGEGCVVPSVVAGEPCSKTTRFANVGKNVRDAAEDTLCSTLIIGNAR